MLNLVLFIVHFNFCTEQNFDIVVAKAFGTLFDYVMGKFVKKYASAYTKEDDLGYYSVCGILVERLSFKKRNEALINPLLEPGSYKLCG